MLEFPWGLDFEVFHRLDLALVVRGLGGGSAAPPRVPWGTLLFLRDRNDRRRQK